MTELYIFVLISGKQKGQMTSAFHQRRRKHPRSMTSARGRIKEYFDYIRIESSLFTGVPMLILESI